jgi:hypothetical protein
MAPILLSGENLTLQGDPAVLQGDTIGTNLLGGVTP